MSPESPPSSPQAGPGQRAFTLRALLIGLILAAGAAALAPVNDWSYRNTYLYGQHMPILVIAVAAVLALVNPWLGRRRFGVGECAVILGMLLVLGGVVGTGLLRQFPALIAGPARELAVRQSVYGPLVKDGQALPVPKALFLEVDQGGLPDRNAESYRTVIDGFHLGGSEEVPWSAWIPKVLAWSPLLLCLLALGLGLAALVRRQWIHHERLPYPLAHALGDLIGERPLWRDLWFRIGVGSAVLILGSQILMAWGFLPVAFPTSLVTAGLFDPVTIKQSMSTNLLLSWQAYLGVVAIAFLLPADLSFSMWFFVILGNALFILTTNLGMPISHRQAAEAGIGGFLVQAVVILWIGRAHYLQAFRAAFRRTGDDPLVREAAWAARLLLVGGVGLVAVLCMLGAHLHHAVIVALVSVAFLLVIGRLVAEGGIPLVNIPQLPNEVIFGLTGLSAPAAALFPLALVWMITDGREHLVPYAVTADRIAEAGRVGAGPRWSGVLAVTVIIGATLSGISMLILAYLGDGMNNLDGWWKTPLGTGLKPLAQVAEGVPPEGGSMGAYAVGGAVTGGLAVARLHWAWWPFHPLGFIVAMTYANQVMWFSFLLGWLGKALVMRWGGQALYRTLRPLALGLIAGEALIALTNLVVALAVRWGGGTIPPMPRFLPV